MHFKDEDIVATRGNSGPTFNMKKKRIVKQEMFITLGPLNGTHLMLIGI